MISKKNLISNHYINLKNKFLKYGLFLNYILFGLFVFLLIHFLFNNISIIENIYKDIYFVLFLLIINISKIFLISIIFYFFFYFSEDNLFENFFIFVKKFNKEQTINQFLPFIGSLKRINSLKDSGITYVTSIKVYLIIIFISFFFRFFFLIILENFENIFLLFLFSLIFFSSYFLLIKITFNFKNHFKNSFLLILFVSFTILLDLLLTFLISKSLNFNLYLNEIILLNNMTFLIDILKVFGSNLLISEFFMGTFFQFYKDLSFNDGVTYRILIRFIDFFSLIFLLLISFFLSRFFPNFYIKEN